MPSRQEMEAAIRAAVLAVNGMFRMGQDEYVRRDLLAFYDPNLEDVLMALDHPDIPAIAVRIGGDLMRHIGGQNYGAINVGDEGVWWQMRQPLSGQSDATVSALYGIISGKGKA